MDLVHIPPIPLDIAREILEATARKHRDMILSLMLVDRLVHSWIEPILYEVVRILDESQLRRFIKTVDMKTAVGNIDIISRNVQVLQFGSNVGVLSSPSSLLRVVQVCHNAEHIWVSTVFSIIMAFHPADSKDMLPAFLTMHPTRLRIAGGDKLSAKIFSTGAWTSITHLFLETFDPLILTQHVPALSHLIYLGIHESIDSLDAAISVFTTLAQRERLVVCAIIIHDPPRVGPTICHALDVIHVRDCRFVAIDPAIHREDDWVAAYYGQKDLFSVAEDKVASLRLRRRAT